MRLLLVEDKDSFRRLLVQSLQGTDWDVAAVGSPQEALDALALSAFEVLVTDLRLPGFSGLELLRRAKRLQPGLRVLLMSAFGEPRDIVEAIHWGADDFLPKPFDLDHFQDLLGRMASLAEAPPPDRDEPWIALSPAQRKLDDALERAATGDTPVLFLGPGGVGKARAARRLHVLRHPRAPFLSLSITSLGPGGPDPRTLRRLRGGTLHLSDLDEATPAQALALGRLFDATGGDFHWSGSARVLGPVPGGLQQRLGTLVLALPPLMERPEDIIPLFRTLLGQAARRQGRALPVVDRTLERGLLQRPWPGNVRELAEAVDQALTRTRGPVLAPLPNREGAPFVLCEPPGGPLDARLDHLRHQAEAELLQRALAQHPGNLQACAEDLGLTGRTLAQRLREHHISLEDGT